ncbi:pyridoxal 5'-phosphate synthase glutaminase subunit PdxT [Patescibacteria group bacterium]|nr:pyridoxal 5'-phosphate synthase glutaminase subunit PdxT [Patescibacteria group bacterium]
MKIAILDIQGSVVEHLRALEACGVDVVRVKKPADLEGCAGLVIPGGESTTLSKLLSRFGLRDAILAHKDLGIWGTCAGAILLAKEIEDGEGVESLGLMDIKVKRNAYGRQLDSFEAEVVFAGKKVPAVFIRAPKISEVKRSCDILASSGDEVVAVREGKYLATTFHPEMTNDLTVVQYFISMCA